MNTTNIARSFVCKRGYTKNKEIDLASAQVMFQDALTLILNEDLAALRILRDLIRATTGFENLSAKMHKRVQSIHRMVSDTGNPTFHNLMAILTVIRKSLNVQVQVAVVPAWKSREMEIERSRSVRRITGMFARV